MPLPPEIWLDILDLSKIVGGTQALAICALVSREWYERCRNRLYETVHIRTRQQLYLLRRSLQENALLCQLVNSLSVLRSGCRVEAYYHEYDTLDLDIVFVALASILPNLSFLCFRRHIVDSFGHGTLRIVPVTLQYASLMDSVRSLTLHNLQFDTLAIFGRFIFAFPSLATLICTRVTKRSHGGERVVEELMSRRMNLRMLDVSILPAVFAHTSPWYSGSTLTLQSRLTRETLIS